MPLQYKSLAKTPELSTGSGVTTREVDFQLQSENPPMAYVKCSQCAEAFTLALGVTLRVWQNSSGTIISADIRCPKCGQEERLPKVHVQQFDHPHLQLDLRGKSDDHRHHVDPAKPWPRR